MAPSPGRPRPGHLSRFVPNLSIAAQRILHWSLVSLFLVAATTAVIFRSSGYTHFSADSGQYFAEFRSSRLQISAEEYQFLRRRARVLGWATLTAYASLCGVIATEAFFRTGNWRRRN